MDPFNLQDQIINIVVAMTRILISTIIIPSPPWEKRIVPSYFMIQTRVNPASPSWGILYWPNWLKVMSPNLMILFTTIPINHRNLKISHHWKNTMFPYFLGQCFSSSWSYYIRFSVIYNWYTTQFTVNCNDHNDAHNVWSTNQGFNPKIQQYYTFSTAQFGGWQNCPFNIVWNL